MIIYVICVFFCIFAAKCDEYGTESEQKPQIVLLH